MLSQKSQSIDEHNVGSRKTTAISTNKRRSDSSNERDRLIRLKGSSAFKSVGREKEVGYSSMKIPKCD